MNQTDREPKGSGSQNADECAELTQRIRNGQTPSKVVIHVEGGLVQAVYSDLDALDVSVIDVDDLEEDFLRAERDNYLASKTLPLNEIDFAFNPDAPEAKQ